MRIPSGKTDQLIFFVAVDINDLTTRKTGLTSFTVYRSRNGAAAAIYTTPTVAELSAANMPGVYALTVDEDTTIASTSDSEEYCVHVTQASMAPITRTIELYRRETTSGNTLLVDSNGRVDVIKVAGTTQTARDIGASVIVATNNDKTGYSLSAGGVQAIWDALTSALTTVGSIGKLLVTDIDAAISSRSTYAGGDTSGTTTLLSRLGSPVGASISADIAALPTTTTINAIKTKTDNLPSDPADASDIAGSFTTVNSTIGAIKTKTDSLNFTVAGQIDSNIQYVNDVQVIGNGSAGTPWGP